MLLEFKTKSYKSFVEEVRFSIVAAPKQSGLDYSLLKEKAKGKSLKNYLLMEKFYLIEAKILQLEI